MVVENRQGEVKNSMGNGETKELICTTYEHELRLGGVLEGMGLPSGVDKGKKKMGQL